MATIINPYRYAAAGGAASIPTVTSATLVGHYDANIGVEEGAGDPAENGDAVTAWIDQSGNGNDGASFTEATYNTAGPSVDFTGTNPKFDCGSIVPSTHSIGGTSGRADSTSMVMALKVNIQSDSRMMLFTATGGVSSYAWALQDGSSSGNLDATYSAKYYKNGVEFTGGNYTRNALHDAINTNTDMVLTNVGFGMNWAGLWFGGYDTTWDISNVSLYELAIYDGELDATDQAAVEDYMTTKWGI